MVRVISWNHEFCNVTISSAVQESDRSLLRRSLFRPQSPLRPPANSSLKKLKMNYMKDRGWMYEPSTVGGKISSKFANGVEAFMKVASDDKKNVTEVRCPCVNCKGLKFKLYHQVMLHLHQKGFMSNYHVSDSDSGSAGWVDENARLFAEAYEAELQRQRESGVEVNTEVENTVYKQISSSLKKRRDRVSYTGNIPQASAPRPRNAPFSSTIPNYETMRTQMEAQYKQAMDAHLQQMQEMLQQTIQETMQQQQVYMRQTLQEEMKKWSQDMEQCQNDMSDDDA